MHGSHDMRHIGFCRLTVVNGYPGFEASQFFSNMPFQLILEYFLF